MHRYVCGEGCLCVFVYNIVFICIIHNVYYVYELCLTKYYYMLFDDIIELLKTNLIKLLSVTDR